MRHYLSTLQNFEQKLNEVINENYSILLKELDELWRSTLKSRLCNTYALEFSLKKEINEFKKALSVDDDIIQAEKEELKLKISALTFKKEEQREDTPTKDFVGTEQETTYETVINNNKKIAIDDATDSPIDSSSGTKQDSEQATSHIRDKLDDNYTPEQKRKEDSKASVESILSKCLSESLKETTTVPIKKEPSPCDPNVSKPEDTSKPNLRKRKYSTEKVSTAKDNSKVGGATKSKVGGAIKWPPKVGSMIATLFEDGFFIGKVKTVNQRKGIVNVFYMDRCKATWDKESSIEDKYWVWPEKYEIYTTYRKSVFGENVVLNLTEHSISQKQRVFLLEGYQMWSDLAKNSVAKLGKS